LSQGLEGAETLSSLPAPTLPPAMSSWGEGRSPHAHSPNSSRLGGRPSTSPWGGGTSPHAGSRSSSRLRSWSGHGSLHEDAHSSPKLSRRSSTASGSFHSGSGTTPFNKAMSVFKRFDTNKDGKIDRTELRLIMHTLDSKWTADRVDALFKAIDVNKDGYIQFEELLRWTFAGQGQEQPAFRQAVSLDEEVRGLVVIEVRQAAGETVFGPEELLGTLTVGQLRRKVRARAGIPVGCLCFGDTILRDSMEVGVYAVGPTMDLTMVEDAFSMLSEACCRELQELGALRKFDGRSCIRVGGSGLTDSVDMRLQGDHEREFMLLADGSLLAKEYRYTWRLEESSGQVRRSWSYAIAEGSFSILDPGTCHVELHWRSWAAREGQDDTGLPPTTEILKPWEAQLKEEDDISTTAPHHLLPSKAGQANVLFIARDWLLVSKDAQGRRNIQKYHPLAGLPMPGIDEGVLDDLEMDASNLAYWCHGTKAAGPFK